MPQDPFERVQVFLSEKRVNPLALLLDLTTLLPEPLLQRAIWLARNAGEDALRAFLVQALAKRLPTRIDRIELTKEFPVPAGTAVKEVSIPEGKEAKRLIARLTEQQRYKVFDELLMSAETGKEIDLYRFPQTKSARHTEPKSTSDEADEVTALDPPTSTGGGDFTWTTVEEPFVGPLDEEELEFTGEGGGGGAAAVDEEYESVGVGESESADGGGGGGFEAVEDGFESFQPPAPEPQPTASASADDTEERRDIVNLGFAHKDAADNTVKPNEPLQTGHSYYFWLNIGRKHKDAIGAPTPIDIEKLPEEAVLTVAIFGFKDELVISPCEDVGELKIQKDGTVKVLRQPVDKDSIPLSAGAPNDYLDDFLVFPISVPPTEALHRLRCNIYCAQVLVQSHVISVNARSKSDPIPEACTKKLDYVLSQSLRASHLASMTKEPHLLSIMVNNNGDGSHSFRFFGTDGGAPLKDDARIDGQKLAGFLKQARRAMHKVSWGNEDEWDETKQMAYRYQSKTFDRKKLAKDLAYLARAGWRIYDGFAQLLSTPGDELETLLANPGLLQIALKLSPKAVVPAAVMYDYSWLPDNFDFENTDFDLCPTFSDAIDKARVPGGPPLEDCACFKGGCALKAKIAEVTADPDKTLADLPPMICPSGFWGYRHSLGLPLTLDGTNQDIPPVINFKDELQVIASVSTDPLFIERDPHLERLKALKTTLKLEREEGYQTTVKRLKKTPPHVLYFYCHGGIRANTELPYLEIGAKDRFGPEVLRGEKISWKGPNPLVFINGCHTTSLNPEITLDFVSSFVQNSGAAGVIGTEITIFEPLAAKFAEECLGRFIGAAPHTESMPIGKAVRGARLELLRQGNPLGLVYIPYAVATLRLQQQN
jgi:hypothetical protein